MYKLFKIQVKEGFVKVVLSILHRQEERKRERERERESERVCVREREKKDRRVQRE